MSREGGRGEDYNSLGTSQIAIDDETKQQRQQHQQNKNTRNSSLLLKSSKLKSSSSSSSPFTKLSLRIHAANLPRFGLLKTLPDTYAVVTSVSGRESRSGPEHLRKSFNNNNYPNHNDHPIRNRNHSMSAVEWGRTEIIKKNSHPQWTTTFTLDYEYGSECYFYVQIFRLSHSSSSSSSSSNSNSNNNNHQDAISLGNALCEVGDILGSRNHTKVKRLPKKGGVVFCRLEPILDVANREKVFRFQFSANNLVLEKSTRSFPFSKKSSSSSTSTLPDTFFQISKQHPNSTLQSWIAVYRSSPVYESLDPTWDAGEIDLETCCNGDLDRPLRLSIVQYKKKGQDVTIAECETTLRVILDTQQDYYYAEDSWDAEVSKQGFQLVKSLYEPSHQQKMVGRMKVIIAQLIDTSNEEDHDYNNNNNNNTFDVHKSLNEIPNNNNNRNNHHHHHHHSSSSNSYHDNGSYDFSSTSFSEGGETNNETAIRDPYAIDITKLPTPMAAPATFQDYVRDGILLDFCVAIDFTSSNGDPRIPGTLHDQSSIETMNDYEETIVSIGNALAMYSDQFAVWGFGAKFEGVTRHIFQCGSEAQVHGVEGMLSAYKSTFQSDLIMSGPTLYHDVIKAAAVRARRHQELGSPRRYCILLIITDGMCQEMEETKRKLGVYSKVPLSVIFVGVGRADFQSMEYLCEPYAGNRSNSTWVEFRRHQHDPASLGIAALKYIPSQVVEYMHEMEIYPSM